MIEAVTSDRIRAAEGPLLAAGVPLMERAAHLVSLRVADVLRTRAGAVAGARVLVLVGPGNNGGDGLHAAALLARRGARVTAALLAERAHAAGLAAARDAGVRLVASPGKDRRAADPDVPRAAQVAVAREALAAHVVVDALCGIGASGALRGSAARVVREINRGRDVAASPYVVAVDVPSGIGVDDGVVPGPVLAADLVLACGGPVAGLLLPPASRLAPVVEVLDLGVDVPEPGEQVVRRVEDADVRELWPVPHATDDKYARGVVAVVAGSRPFPGAGVLCAGAAVASGAGMVRYVGPRRAEDLVLAAHPEVVPGDGRAQAWVVGPGLEPDDEDTERLVRAALGRAGAGSEGHFAATGVWGSGAGAVDGGVVPVVVDAGALALLPTRCAPWVVLTPHAGELARLLTSRGRSVSRSAVEAAPAEHAAEAARLTGATVLLKGATTVVVGRGGVLAQAEAPAWLATAGAGDVLAGLLGTLLAARAADAVRDPALVARLAALAALVHGRAAHDANPGGPVSASAVVAQLPRTIARLLAARA
ncbi:NAD(P)H-hydrate dehydratase [Sanguibacter sp. HDW7]|uniref:NAD(P)H-hydrate dehydratase n=1 Tax=Sanguibacter sp. HDW7 TaxID=2714931 RepID=UPI0014081DE4|nr:NAD(P)H-hydrate dehydratase [Sanguibacter sp. HDW7]QIK82768.1 bifunctional ADP-dependent (S)-NAD(P)H-hydrate dehydratase/NAD(P)H-hydrate epimerase [Sanguibacter sp. HDW7]